MTYQHRMEAPMSAQQVTVRKGFCHVVDGQTYIYGYICTTDSPIYKANPAAFLLAPAHLLEAKAEEPVVEELPPLPIEVADDEEELEV